MLASLRFSTNSPPMFQRTKPSQLLTTLQKLRKRKKNQPKQKKPKKQTQKNLNRRKKKWKLKTLSTRQS